ncbi:MAG: hypothetical protein H7070_06880 [Saprospiraceae bacterium]|nr:hypothetical protein [Pyrinomonadaceae bacterium]
MRKVEVKSNDFSTQSVCHPLTQVVPTGNMEIALREIPVGGRLLIRSKKDWRIAVVSRVSDEKITLSICSPSGRNYRMGRLPDAVIGVDGMIPVLKFDTAENWRDNFSPYDSRW